MKFQHFFLTFSLVVAVSGILGAVGLVSLAEHADIRATYPDIAGTYQCWKSYMDDIGISCGIQPPLTLFTDGTYRHAQETGAVYYDPNIHTLSLAHSSIPGVGVVKDTHITFTASLGAKKQTMVFINEKALPFEEYNASP